MTLAEKRDIVRSFKAGVTMGRLCLNYADHCNMICEHNQIQAVIRDYMNGKFKLEKAKVKK